MEGPLLIIIAATLWAIDALIRTPLTQRLSSTSIVFWEHVVGILILSPLFIRSIPILKKLKPKDWMFFTILAAGSSVLGTILFTKALGASFATGDFITPLLLQKLQPILVILLSALFLREKIHKKFFLFAPLALIGGYLMSFGLTTPTFTFSGKEAVVLLSLGAAFFWGSGTILSKTVLKTYSGRDSTFVRFLLAIPLAFLATIIFGEPLKFALPAVSWLRFILIALSTGAVGLLIYYRGLQKTQAHIATIAELAFPLVSVLIGITSLNPYGAPQSLSLPQITGITVLLIGIIGVSQTAKLHLPKTITGVVGKGAGDGKKLGFPTANVSLTHPLDLPHGVYAAWVMFNKKKYQSVVHYGPRLVFDETITLFEVHILDFKENLYGKSLTVELIAFVRGTQQFASLDAMVEQIKDDCDVAKRKLTV